MVSIKNISKTFGKHTVLRDCSLEIKAGERFVLLGQSGCGKTTLLRLVAGFEHPDSGSIEINGECIDAYPPEQRPVGFIFQKHALFPHMTVFDNIAVGPRIAQKPENEIKQQVNELLELVRLPGKQNAWPGQLSGGESQRVALARAIINRPRVLLLDEPLSALDASFRKNLQEELIDIQQTFGITFLFVTHDRDEAMTLGQRMAVMHNGRMLQAGSPEDLYNHPTSSHVASFLGEVNHLTGSVASIDGTMLKVALDCGGILTALNNSTHSPGTRVECLVRPEQVKLFPEGTHTDSPNQLETTLMQETFTGSRRNFRMRARDDLYLHAVLPVDFHLNSVEPSEKVMIAFQPEDVMLFPLQQKA